MAVACVVRGIPPTSGSRIFFPLLCGILSLAVLTLQSSAWTALQSDGELQRRSRDLASRVWWAVVVCLILASAILIRLQPNLVDVFENNSSVPVFAVFVLAGLMGARFCINVKFDLGTFAGASCMVLGLLAVVAARL